MEMLDYDFFLDLLTSSGTWLNETNFSFADDPEQQERWLGCLPQYEQPYWVGGCDIPKGADFHTAKELMEAPIFNGKSLRERWDQVRIYGMMGLDLEEWWALYMERGGGPSPRGGPTAPPA